MQNAFVESFNGRLRDECLNEHVFTTLREARALIEEWRIDYNTQRPHSALGYQTPAAFAKHLTTAANPNTPPRTNTVYRPVAQPAQNSVSTHRTPVPPG